MFSPRKLSRDLLRDRKGTCSMQGGAGIGKCVYSMAIGCSLLVRFGPVSFLSCVSPLDDPTRAAGIHHDQMVPILGASRARSRRLRPLFASPNKRTAALRLVIRALLVPSPLSGVPSSSHAAPQFGLQRGNLRTPAGRQKRSPQQETIKGHCNS